MGISPLPRRVHFGNYIGEVIDEVWVQEDYEVTDYRFFMQQIRWSDGSESIRFAYYSKPHERDDDAWNYSNRPPNMKPSTLGELLRGAGSRRWFRGL